MVYAPYSHGADIVFQVTAPGPELTFVVGDIFDDPTPLLTAELVPLQDSMSADPSSALTAVRRHVLRTAKRAQANDQGILRLKMLKEGLDRIGSDIVAAGITAAGIVVTYNALKGIVNKVLNEQKQAHQEPEDYAYRHPGFFSYD